MDKKIKISLKKILGASFAILFVFNFYPFFKKNSGRVEADLSISLKNSSPPFDFIFFQNNTLDGISSLEIPKMENPKIIVGVVTGYSSTYFETDDTPHLTASGSLVRDGIVANNFYPFGTRVKFPEIFGDKIFVVEDRMNPKRDWYYFDIWFPSYSEAKNFGAKITYVEILD
jgi:3D (Asp-Asp-Asp) domain-containing protein